MSERKDYVSDVSESPRNDTNHRNISVNIERNVDVNIQWVQPDTTVNQKLQLESPFSLNNFYDKEKTVELVEKIRSSPVAIFSNADNDEYLLAYQYEGNTQNAFSCFEIGYLKDLRGVDNNKINHVSEKFFKTESDLKLGLSFADVVKIKGNSFKKESESNKTTLQYRLEDFDRSPFLNRYNMPGYFIELVLIEDKVVKILFGFDYP